MPSPASSSRISREEWKLAKRRVAQVLGGLDGTGFVTAAKAGTTQADGFEECSDVFRARGLELGDLVGFCFYTGQDAKRAKATGRLSLAFWGAPEGAEPDMVRAGGIVVRAFQDAGFTVHWNGAAAERPEVDLRQALPGPAA